jgi:hypothetical protein
MATDSAREECEKGVSIVVVPEDQAALVPPRDHVDDRAWRTDS